MSVLLSTPKFLFALLLLLSSHEILQVAGYASYMTQSAYCSRSMTAGTQIMSRAAVSSTSRSVSITRNGVALSSGAAYVYGETLVASLSDTSGDYVMEVTGGASVTGGGCTKTRVANKAATFTLPTSGSATISIKSAWTTAKSTPVGISTTFTLVAPASAASNNPTVSPSRIPTLAPNISPYPTYVVTVTPTRAPTPTAAPSNASAVNDDDKESGVGSFGNALDASSISNLSRPIKTLIGAALGLGIILILLIGAYCFASYRLSRPADERHISQKGFTFTRLASSLAVILAIVAVIMVSYWTKEPTNSDGNYLGKPSWKENLFAWHPVLMVAGFFVSQIAASAAWALFRDHYTAKLTHVFFQCAGMASMLAGLWAVWEYKADNQSFHFTTTHSWLGIAAIGLFIFTFLFGSLMASLTRCFPESILRKAYDLKSAHKNLGIWALSLTTIAVVTGVMDILPNGSCNPSSEYKGDSAQYYYDTPTSCRLANGLSTVVFIAAGLAALAIAYRGDSFGFTLTAAPASAPPVAPAPSTESRPQSTRSYSSVPNGEAELVEATAVVTSVDRDSAVYVQVVPGANGPINL